MPAKDFNILLSRLDKFIRRYYFNQIIRGILLFFAIGLSYYLIIAVLEYWGNFGVTLRTILFYSFVVLLISVFVWFFVRPLLGFLRIGKVLSYKDAAKILRQHFPEIKDTLENTLELADMASQQNSDLLQAAIEQKTEQISPLPFLKALPLKSALKYIRYIIPPAVIIALLIIFWPSAIAESTERIVNYRTEFIPPPPFQFVLQNKTLSIKKGDDIKLSVTTQGENIPDKVWVYFNGNHFVMQKTSANQFEYTFKNLNNSLNIYFVSGDVKSETFKIQVLPTPTLLNYQISINPPKYTGETAQKINNQGDVTVPVGSHIQWSFNTRETDDLYLKFSDSTNLPFNKSEKFFVAEKTMMNTLAYQVVLSNRNFENESPIQYRINVVPDLFPEIKLQAVRDSLDMNIYYYNGVIQDDYGFNSLRFCYFNGDVNKPKVNYINVPFNRNQNPQEFFFAFDFSQLKNQDITSVNYYFEVGDNDAVHGSKKTRSKTGEFRFPTKDELNDINNKTNKEIEDKINKAREISNLLQKDMQDLQRKLIDKNMSQWERQQSMQQVVERQNELEKLTQEIAKQNKERNQYMDSYSNRNDEILKKQEQIEELLENLMDEELKDMIEELQKLMEQNKTAEMQDLMKDLNLSYEDFNRQLDNNLEILKRMEVEERLQNNVNQLKELSEKHEKLSQESLNKENSSEELSQKQQQHQDELKKIEEDYKQTLEKNQDLDEPMKLQEFNEDFEQIKQEMQEGQENLSKDKQKKASKNQKKTSEQMKKLSESMQSMMNQAMMSANEENIEDLKQLLENLIQFSFDQEELIAEFSKTSSMDPNFRNIVNRQSKMESRYQMIDDSLTALGARVPQAGTFIRKEQKSIRQNLKSVMENISNNRIFKVPVSQQLIMTHTNNLALLLSETLDQMQNEMNSMCNSDGQCQSKSGKGKPKMGEMRKRQQNMKQQLQQMLDMMKQGQQPNGQKQQQMSKSLAKMLAEQEIMQQMLNEMMSSQNISPDAAKMLREINQMMEQNKNDLINRNISPDMITRQEMILSRMLEAEKSEFEREIDKKRKSEEAKDYKISNPEKAFRKSKEKEKFNELLEYSNMKLNKYYKEKYQQYLIKISE